MHILKIPEKQSLSYIAHKQSLENDFFFPLIYQKVLKV